MTDCLPCRSGVRRQVVLTLLPASISSRLSSDLSSVTNSTGFLLLFGSGRIALAPFLAFFTQLLLVQIGLVLFIGKTTAQTSGGNSQCRCNFYRTATWYHMPWAFIQRIAIRKRKLTTTRSTLMRHSFSYRGRLRSSNTEVAMSARCCPPKRIRRSQARSRSPKQTTLSHQCVEPPIHACS